MPKVASIELRNPHTDELLNTFYSVDEASWFANNQPFQSDFDFVGYDASGQQVGILSLGELLSGRADEWQKE